MKIGSLIGHYRIVGKLGSGGMGAVFLAEHALLGRRAAVKALLPEMSRQRLIVERFFDEARATSAISDPGVVQVFDFGYHVDGTAYLVMEYLEGESVQARIDRLGSLGPSEALRIARQVASSLAAAHAQGIIHRDLKPENLFLVRDVEARGGERTKLLDFGVAKCGTARLTLSGSLLGTPAYMSPEQCRGPSSAEPRSDVYALGCVMFHMLTGRPPFVGPAGDVVAAQLHDPPPRPSRMTGGLTGLVDGLVMRCMAKNPGDRYASASALQQAIEAVAQLDAIELAGPMPMPGLRTELPTVPISLVACEGATLPPETTARMSRLRAGLGLLVLGALGTLGLILRPVRFAVSPAEVWVESQSELPPAPAPVVALDAGVPEVARVLPPLALPAPPPEPPHHHHHHHRRTPEPVLLPAPVEDLYDQR